MHKYCLIFLITFFSFQSLLAQAQERVILKLNKYLIPIQENTPEAHAFNQVISEKDDLVITKTYDLQNRLVSQKKEKFNKELGYHEAITSTYDSLQNLVSSEIKNLDNSSFIKVFLEGEQVVSKLTYLEDKNYYFYRGNMDSAWITGDFNPMLPKPNIEKKDFQKALAKELHYPPEARNLRETGTALVGIEVDENGQLIHLYWANPGEVHPSLIKEAIRVMEKINPDFEPAIDYQGNPTKAFFTIPIRFALS